MSRNKLYTLVTLAIVAIMAFGIVGYAAAQGPGGGGNGGGRGPRGGGQHGDFSNGIAGPNHDEIAAALGLTPGELFEALRSGQTLEELAEAAGVDYDSLDLGFTPRIRLAGRFHGELADALGLTAGELLDALTEGKTLSEIAAEQGVDLADIALDFDTNHTTIAEALGLTPIELFDLMFQGMTLEEIAEQQDVDLESLELDFGFGMRGGFGSRMPGFGHHHPFGPMNPDDAPATPEAEVAPEDGSAS